MIKRIFTIMALAVSLMACSGNAEAKAEAAAADSAATQTDMNTPKKANPDSLVLIKTTAGDITVRLFGDTPGHQANFLKLVREGFYNNTLFHRVIKEFMVQAGDPDSREAKPGQQLGAGDPGYTIPAEIDYPHHFHKRGALAAARTGDQVNPERRSSGSQFYIVTGKKVSEGEIAQLEQQFKYTQMQDYFNGLARQNMDKIRQMQQAGDNAGLQQLQQQLVQQTEQHFAGKDVKLPDDVRNAYLEVGGTPHLDGQYTVFGEVVSGMDVVEKIENAATNPGDRPKEDIRILSASIVGQAK